METLTNLTKIILGSKEEQIINKGISKNFSSRHLGDTEKNKCLIARTIKMHLTIVVCEGGGHILFWRISIRNQID